MAVSALCVHLQHGLWSATQTFGFGRGQFDGFRRPVATGIAGAIWVGYLVVPLAIQIGMIRL